MTKAVQKNGGFPHLVEERLALELHRDDDTRDGEEGGHKEARLGHGGQRLRVDAVVDGRREEIDEQLDRGNSGIDGAL